MEAFVAQVEGQVVGVVILRDEEVGGAPQRER